MLVQEDEGGQLYGKTGTGFGGTGWFVGFRQEGRRTYFAVYLADEIRADSGSDAKEEARNLLAGESAAGEMISFRKFFKNAP